MQTQHEKEMAKLQERMVKAVNGIADAINRLAEKTETIDWTEITGIRDALEEMNGYLPTEQKEEQLAEDEFTTEDDLPFS